MTAKNEVATKWTLFYDPHTKRTGKKTRDLTKDLVTKLKESLTLSSNEQYRPAPFLKANGPPIKLAFVDIAIADNNKMMKVLCEVEESYSPPKKIIGDIVDVLLSDNILINGEEYLYHLKPHLFIVLFKVGTNLKKYEKLVAEIQKRVQSKTKWEVKIIHKNTENLDEYAEDLKKWIKKLCV